MTRTDRAILLRHPLRDGAPMEDLFNATAEASDELAREEIPRDRKPHDRKIYLRHAECLELWDNHETAQTAFAIVNGWRLYCYDCLHERSEGRQAERGKRIIELGEDA